MKYTIDYILPEVTIPDECRELARFMMEKKIEEMIDKIFPIQTEAFTTYPVPEPPRGVINFNQMA